MTSTQKSARGPLVMNVLAPLITYSSPSRIAVVRMPATSEPAPGSVIPRQPIRLALDPRHEVALLLLLGAEQVHGRQDHVGLDREAHVGAAGARVAHALGAHERVEVVAALPAVLLREAEAEIAQLAGPAHDLAGPVGVLPLVAVGVHLLLHPGAHRLAQVEVLVGEEEVLPRAVVVGLDDAGAVALGSSSKSVEYYFLLLTTLREDPLRGRRRTSRRSRSTTPRRATRSPTSCWPSCSRRCGLRRATTRSARSSSPRPTRRSSRRAPTWAGSPPTPRPRTSTSARRRSRRVFKELGELGKPSILAANGHVLAGRARDRAGLRPDRRQGHRGLRHARDQRRPVPVHDHGADLPQRRPQEDDRDAAARRAIDGGGGARGRDREQGRARRRVRRRGRRVGAEAGLEVAPDHAPGQGRDVAPAGHAARRRARLPARRS